MSIQQQICYANQNFYNVINAVNPNTHPFNFFDLSDLLISEQDKQIFQHLKVQNAKLVFPSIDSVRKDIFMNTDVNLFSFCGNGYVLENFVFYENAQNSCIDALKNFIINKAFYVSQIFGADDVAITLVAREGGDDRATRDYSFHRDPHQLDYLDEDMCKNFMAKLGYEYNLGFNLIGSNGTIFYKPKDVTTNLMSVPIPFYDHKVSTDDLYSAGLNQGAIWLKGECDGSGAIHTAPDVQHQRLAILFTPYQKESTLDNLAFSFFENNDLAICQPQELLGQSNVHCEYHLV